MRIIAVGNQKTKQSKKIRIWIYFENRCNKFSTKLDVHIGKRIGLMLSLKPLVSAVGKVLVALGDRTVFYKGNWLTQFKLY